MQAIRRVDMHGKPAPLNLMPGSSSGGKRRGSATAIVATRDIAELVYNARNKPELSHAGVEMVTRTRKTVQHWELEQEHEPVYACELQVRPRSCGC